MGHTVELFNPILDILEIESATFAILLEMLENHFLFSNILEILETDFLIWHPGNVGERISFILIVIFWKYWKRIFFISHVLETFGHGDLLRNTPSLFNFKHIWILMHTFWATNYIKI